jgi:hypothetical protein
MKKPVHRKLKIKQHEPKTPEVNAHASSSIHVHYKQGYIT